MVFQPNIPQPTDRLNKSQGDLLGNNQDLDVSFNVDHTAYSVGTNVGMHKKVTLQSPLLADPNQISPISSLYTKGSPAQLFFQNGALISDIVQLTGTLPLETGNDAQGGTYTLFFLPWAMKLFMGSTTSFSGTRTFTLSGSTGFGVIYTSQATPFGGGAVAVSFSPSGSASTFQITTGNAIPVRWMAITT